MNKSGHNNNGEKKSISAGIIRPSGGRPPGKKLKTVTSPRKAVKKNNSPKRAKGSASPKGAVKRKVRDSPSSSGGVERLMKRSGIIRHTKNSTPLV